ncbi:MAG: NlpC/P60 family protein [Cellulosilyticaceae bacterium]
MRKVKKCIGIGLLFLLSFIQVYAFPNNDQAERIFPSYSGMSGQVAGKNINIRKYPDIYAETIGVVHSGPVKVIGKNHEWYKIKINNTEGWIYNQYVRVKDEEIIPYAKVLGEEIVEYGMQFIGTPYVWGGSNLKHGVDCSGFTQEVYKAFDIDISRVSYMQANDGKIIPLKELMVGDLIFFDTTGKNDGSISHVGIYVGDKKFIHSDGTRGVMISSLTSNYYSQKFVRGIRVL